ncbi:MAG: sugar transferase, partial [Chryseobacterium sp.]
WANFTSFSINDDAFQGTLTDITYPEDFDAFMEKQTLLTLPDIVVMEVDQNPDSERQVKYIKAHPLLQGIIVIALGTNQNSKWREKALQLKLNDYYCYPFPIEDFLSRLNFLVKFKLVKPKFPAVAHHFEETYRLPLSKRIFDIIASMIALLMLSPVFLIVAMILKIGSNAEVIYSSKRVGAAYRIFDFYKFRSMRVGADELLEDMKDQNQYRGKVKKSRRIAFLKFSNDPRITPFGSFLRKTSLDELPQLINVLIGDMSLVGNRPLPLYEAEQLTTDKWAGRFNGPAGLTGLWQISKRGKKDMSEAERKELDNYYANNYSTLLDLEIILKTFPALIQIDKV